MPQFFLASRDAQGRHADISFISGEAIQKPGDTLSLVKGDNPLTGPFYIEGAEPGDTLAVKILDLQVDSNQGVGAFAPGFGALNETFYTPMLHTPLPEKIWFYPIDHVTNTATFKALDSNFSVPRDRAPARVCPLPPRAAVCARLQGVPDCSLQEAAAIHVLIVPGGLGAR